LIYIGGIDKTLSNSRNGHVPIFVWNYLSSKSLDDHVDDAVRCFKSAKEFYTDLKQVEKQLGRDLKLKYYSPGLSVEIMKPQPWICSKYSLLTLES
jgi:hypothetical protein